MITIYNISIYGLCGVLGFIAGVIYLFEICKNEKLQFIDLVYVYIWAVIGAIIGAKILYIIGDFKNVMQFFLKNGVNIDSVNAVFMGGFVFYGGLLGSIIMAYAACKFFCLDVNYVFSLLMPTMPLAHAFGRIGCALVGCCYGIEITDGIGMIYHDSHYAPLEVKLFPSQPIEAFGNLMIFVVLLWCIKTNKFRNKMVVIYMISYSIMRFFLEFFRGDMDRGFFLMLSTSQWISIGIWLVIFFFYRSRLNFR